MYKYFIVIAAFSGAVAVILGAFGAHGLSSVLSEAQLHTYSTGIEYHFYHTFAMLAVSILARFQTHKLLQWSFWAFFAGIALFSGSLYLLATKQLLGIENWSFLGPITPIGGLLFIAGWVLLANYGLVAFNKKG